MTIRHSLALTVLLTLGTAGAALAQDTIIIQPQQETVIREYVRTRPAVAIEVPPDVMLDVGSTLPESVELYPLDVPDMDYRYVMVDGRIVVVDPVTRRVVDVLQ